MKDLQKQASSDGNLEELFLKITEEVATGECWCVTETTKTPEGSQPLAGGLSCSDTPVQGCLSNLRLPEALQDGIV